MTRETKGAKQVQVISLFRRPCLSRAVRGLGPVVAAAGLILTGTATAHASPILADSFEGNPSSRWQVLTSGDNEASFDINQGHARSGVNNGWLRTGTGWSAQRLPVSIGSWGDRTRCTASIYAQPVGTDPQDGAQVALQIWHTNGTKLSETAPWLPATGYQRIATGFVDLNGIDTVYVQAIYGKDGGAKKYVRLDDMTLQCS